MRTNPSTPARINTVLTPIFTYYTPPANVDAFSEPEKVFSQLTTQPSPAALQQLTATIARRLTPQPIKLRADIELTCYTDAGIDAIKKALKAGEAVSTEAVPSKAKLVAPPLYVLGTNATDKVDRTSSHAYLLTHQIHTCTRNLFLYSTQLRRG